MRSAGSLCSRLCLRLPVTGILVRLPGSLSISHDREELVDLTDLDLSSPVVTFDSRVGKCVPFFPPSLRPPLVSRLPSAPLLSSASCPPQTLSQLSESVHRAAWPRRRASRPFLDAAAVARVEAPPPALVLLRTDAFRRPLCCSGGASCWGAQTGSRPPLGRILKHLTPWCHSFSACKMGLILS